jgi:hypothetical protein
VLLGAFGLPMSRRKLLVERHAASDILPTGAPGDEAYLFDAKGNKLSSRVMRRADGAVYLRRFLVVSP